MKRQPFEVTLRAQPTFRLGEPIRVELEVKNAGDERLQVLKSGTPLENRLNEDCLTVKRDGEAVRYDGKRVHWADPPAEAYALLDPGVALKGEVDVSSAYAIDRPGEYTVTLETSFFDVVRITPEDEKPRRRARGEFSPHRVPSTTVQFTVTEDGEPRLTEGEAARSTATKFADVSAKVPNFKGGTSDERDEVTTAHNNAQYYATLAVKQLDTTTANTNALYQTWFGAFDQGRYETVRAVFKEISDRLLTKTVTYDISGSGCDPAWNAYTYDGSSTVWICNGFWGMNPIDVLDAQFSTVLHEWSHAFSGTDDHAYGDADCQTLATNDPGKAIDNGDSYENFVERLAESDFGKTVTLVIDRSTFGKDEVNALLSQGSPATITHAFYVVVDGCWPDLLGITSSSLGASPTVTPNLVVSPAVVGMTVECTSLAAEDSSLPASPQRFTWVCEVRFSDSNGFPSNPGDVSTVALTATIDALAGSAMIRLICEPNPYEVDGPVSWLSTDVRVFQIRAAETRFGVQMGSNATEAPQFIQQVVSNLNAGTSGGDTYEAIAADAQSSALELSEKVNGTSVFNFGLAKVRYRGTIGISNVRVFFRLIPVNSTSTQFDSNTSYRRAVQGATTIPLLGLSSAGDLVSIPCFAEPRVDSSSAALSTQTDPTNVREIAHDASGDEVWAYFGCWLDINQSEPQFPTSPSPNDGPWTSGRQGLQKLMRNTHQCLVAEIAFDPAPIPNGASPGGSDKLAQRNLSIVESANPGSDASRRILTTFDLHPVSGRQQAGLPPDELLIDWGETPSSSIASVFIPEVDAGRIVALADEQYGLHGLRRIDDSTIRLPVGGIGYVPIPANAPRGFTGLLSVELPEGVRKGEEYAIVVRQLTNAESKPILRRAPASTGDDVRAIRWRRVVGSYQVTTPVTSKETILPTASRQLSVLRWILGSLPSDDRWFPVFSLYVSLMAERVLALGGNPGSITGTSDGSGGELITVEEPEDADVLVREGRVAGLIYDCFGDFAGFLLDVCGSEIRYEAREHQIEHLVEMAWRQRITITVVGRASEPARPRQVILRRAPEPHQS